MGDFQTIIENSFRIGSLLTISGLIAVFGENLIRSKERYALSRAIQNIIAVSTWAVVSTLLVYVVFGFQILVLIATWWLTIIALFLLFVGLWKLQYELRYAMRTVATKRAEITSGISGRSRKDLEDLGP